MDSLDSSVEIGVLSAAWPYVLFEQTNFTSHYFESSCPMRTRLKAFRHYALVLHGTLALSRSTVYQGQSSAAICHSTCLGILWARVWSSGI